MAEITVIRMSKFAGTGATKAFVDILFHGMVIKGLTVVDSQEGLFVGMPREKSKKEENKYYNTVYPDSEALKAELTQKILDYYKSQN